MNKVIQSIFIAAVIIYALYLPRMDVIIRDEVRNTQTMVRNVPLGIAIPMNFATTIERGLAKLFDQYYSVPDSLKYTSTGMGWGILAVDTSTESVIQDPYLRRTMSEYISSCFFTGVLLGGKDLNAALYTNDLLSFINSDNIPPTYFTAVYTAANPGGIQKTCTEAYNTDIKPSIQAEMTNSVGPLFASKVTGYSTMPNWIVSEIIDKLGDAGQYLLGISMTGQEMLTQTVIMNSINEGLQRFAAEYSVNPDIIAYAKAMAESQTKTGWIVSAELAKKYMPVIRQVIEAIIYGIFPLILLMMFIPGFTGKILKTYLTLLLWLCMWSPLFSLMNMLVNTRAQTVFSPYAGKFSIIAASAISSTSSDMMAICGTLMWLVPLLAYAIAKGSEYAFVTIAAGIGGHLQSASFQQARTNTLQGMQNLAGTGQAQVRRETIQGSGLDPARALENVAQWDASQQASTYATMQARGLAKVTRAKTNEMAHTVGGGMGYGDSDTAFDTGKIGRQREVAGAEAVQSIANDPRLGFKGDTKKAQEFLADVQTKGAFGGAEAKQKLADKYTGGNVEELQKDIDYVSGIPAAERYGVMRNIGENLYSQTAAAKGYSEAGGFEKSREFATKGGFMKNEGDGIGYMRYIAATHGAQRMALSGKEAQTLTGNPQAGAGIYTMGLNNDGQLIAVSGEAGNRFIDQNYKASQGVFETSEGTFYGTQYTNPKTGKPVYVSGMQGTKLEGSNVFTTMGSYTDPMTGKKAYAVQQIDPDTGRVLSSNAVSGQYTKAILNEEEAPNIFGKGTPAGIYNLATDDSGKIIAARGEGGRIFTTTPGHGAYIKRFSDIQGNPLLQPIVDGLGPETGFDVGTAARGGAIAYGGYKIGEDIFSKVFSKGGTGKMAKLLTRYEKGGGRMIPTEELKNMGFKRSAEGTIKVMTEKEIAERMVATRGAQVIGRVEKTMEGARAGWFNRTWGNVSKGIRKIGGGGKGGLLMTGGAVAFITALDAATGRTEEIPDDVVGVAHAPISGLSSTAPESLDSPEKLAEEHPEELKTIVNRNALKEIKEKSKR